jgi:methyltransferase
VSEPVLGNAILVLVAVQRAVEALWARANARRLVAAGARLVPRDQTAGMIVLHVLWLAGMAIERHAGGARMPPPLVVPLLVVLVATEALRAWTLATLGRRWTIRVVVRAGEAPVARGPYRFLRHPNYWVVLAEVTFVPLWLGAWRAAALAAVPNAVLLLRRIRLEERAWREVAGRDLADRGRAAEA